MLYKNGNKIIGANAFNNVDLINNIVLIKSLFKIGG